MPNKIAIIILHYKYRQLTVACLQSLKNQTYKNFDIYLLIQGSAQEDFITLHNLYDSWDKIKIIDSDTNHGFAEGNNILIRKAMKDEAVKYILTLNNDTKIKPDFLENIIKPFVNEKIGMVQSQMLKMDNPKKIDNLGLEMLKSGLVFNIKANDKLLFCPSAGAACYSRDMMKSIRQERQITSGFESKFIYDYFDSEFFAYAEDLDLGFRALHAGWQPAYAVKAICWHKGSASTSVMSDFAIKHTYRNILWTLYKNLPAVLWLKYGLFIIIGHFLLLFNFSAKKKLIIFCQACIQAWQQRLIFKNRRRLTLSQSKITPSQLEKFITNKIIDKDYLPWKN